MSSRRPERGSDYFAVFSLPRRLTIDLADLEQRYYAVSRTLHPDLFHDRPPAEQAASLRMTALVNRAYKTLKDPVARALYWLELHGESLGRDNERVPPALAARVFEVQEQLEELRAARERPRTAPPKSPGPPPESPARPTPRHAPSPACVTSSAPTSTACGDRLAANFERTDASAGNGAAAAVLADTKKILSELHYVRTLLRDVEKEL